MGNIATLDAVLLVAVLLSMCLGAWRGLVYEVLSVLGWIAAFIAAQLYAAQVGDRIMPLGLATSLRYAGGFALTFVTVAFAGGFVAWLAKKLISSVGLSPVDRLLGAAFGGVRGLLIVLAITFVMRMTGGDQHSVWRASVSGPALSSLAMALKPLLPDALARVM